MVPESPRFLISKDRREEAFDILVKYHAEGDRDSPLVAAEMSQIENTIKLELEAAKQSWADIIRTPGMRKRLLICSLLGLFTQWSGNTLISYYLSSILSSIGYTDSAFQSKINVATNCWALINATAAALLVRRFPRRKMYLTCACSILAVYCGWTIAQERFLTTKEVAAGNAVLFFIFAYSPCYNLGYNALTYSKSSEGYPDENVTDISKAYLVELFPFAVRSRGISVFQFFGRGAGFFSTFVNPIGLQNAKWRYLIMYCVWVGFEIVCIYFLWPETSGRTLEELAFRKSAAWHFAGVHTDNQAVFEDDNLKQKQTAATEEKLFGDVAAEKGATSVHVEAKA